MTWIAFDEKTHNALTEISRAPVMLETTSTDPVDYALSSPRNTVVVVPMETEDEVVLLTVKKNIHVELSPAPVAAKKHAPQSVHYVSGGFLGLGDEVAEEEEPEKKSWWKRLFD